MNAASHKYSADQQLAGQKYVADTNGRTRVEAAKARGGTASTIEQGLISGKIKAAEAALSADLAASRAVDPEEKAFWTQKARQWERFVYQRPQGGKEGGTQLGPDGSLQQRTIQPALGQEGNTPRGTGTKDDPIILK
jgi:hypothetical protein